MNEKICLITGGNSGIGKATAVGLAKKGYRVVLLCRNKERGEVAVHEVILESGNNNVELIVADLASQASVRKAVEEFKQKHDRLDVLINNAAVFLPKRSETVDGIETTFATNYLSHFMLTHLLLDVLKASTPSRIVNVASKHSGVKINFDDLMLKESYSIMKAVGPTKLALVIFTKELAERLAGTGVTVNSLHPGLVKSNLLKDTPWLMRKIFTLLSSDSNKGAETSIYLASSPEVQGVTGQFFAKCKPAKTTAAANDEATAKKLWDASMGLIKGEAVT